MCDPTKIFPFFVPPSRFEDETRTGNCVLEEGLFFASMNVMRYEAYFFGVWASSGTHAIQGSQGIKLETECKRVRGGIYLGFRASAPWKVHCTQMKRGGADCERPIIATRWRDLLIFSLLRSLSQEYWNGARWKTPRKPALHPCLFNLQSSPKCYRSFVRSFIASKTLLKEASCNEEICSFSLPLFVLSKQIFHSWSVARTHAHSRSDRG